MSMYRISLPFPYLQKKLYCSFAVISLRISWDLYTFAMLLLVVDLVHAVGRRRVAVEKLLVGLMLEVSKMSLLYTQQE